MTYQEAFAALDTALGLTEAETTAARQLGWAPDVVAARTKKDFWLAARAGLARRMILEIAARTSGVDGREHYDLDAMQAALGKADDGRIGVTDANHILEELAAGRPESMVLSPYALPLRFWKDANRQSYEDEL